MAIEFKNSTIQALDIGFVDVYTCPGASTALVFGLSISNVEAGVVPITVEGRIYDSSGVTYTHFIAPSTPIEVGGTLVAAGGVQKIVLEAGDKIQLSCSHTDGADAVLSIMEIS